MNRSQLRSFALASSFAFGGVACKTTEQYKSSLAEGAAAGQMCEGLDVSKIKDPKKRARMMAFLLKMMMRDNPRATSLFLAATQNMGFDSFMVEWNRYLKSQNRKPLLTAVDGAISEGSIDVTVESELAKEATRQIKTGDGAIPFPNGKGGTEFLSSALAQARLGEAFAASGMSELEIQKEFETLIKETFSSESFDTGNIRTIEDQKAAANKQVALLKMLDNAAEKAGIGKTAQHEGVTVKVGISDAVLTRGYVESVVELANQELNRPTSRGTQVLKERLVEMDRVIGPELLDKTKLRELVETIEKGSKNKGEKSFQELQRDRALFDRLTNTAELMRELERRGESAMVKRAIERRVTERRTRIR